MKRRELLLVIILIFVFTAFGFGFDLKWKSPVTFTPASPAGTDTVTFKCRVKSGAQASDNIKIGLLIDGSQVNSMVIPHLNQDQEMDVTLTWTAVEGTHTATMMIDPDDTIGVENQLNNDKSVQISVAPAPQPATVNLKWNGSVYITTPDFQGGDMINIRAQIYLQYAALDNVKVITTVDGTQVCEQTVPHIDADSYHFVYCDWLSESGAHTIAFTLDPDNSINETNEGDNTLSAIRSITAPPPDPSATRDLKFNGNIAINPFTTHAGDSQTVSAHLYGTAVTSNNVKVIGGIDGVTKWTHVYPTIVPGEAHKIPSFTWTTTEGNHTAFFTIDPDNTIPELDETDNTLSYNIIVQPAPDPGPAPGLPLDAYWSKSRGIETSKNPPYIHTGDRIKIKAYLELSGNDAVDLKVTAGVDRRTLHTETFPKYQVIRKGWVIFYWNAQAGDHIIWFKIDPQNKQNDTDRTNNHLKRKINVKMSKGPVPKGIRNPR